MNSIYVSRLLKQYRNATGNISFSMDEGFLQWLSGHREGLLVLKDVYDSLGLEYAESDSYELGKGPLDTIVTNPSQMISLYSPIESSFTLSSGTPYVVSDLGIYRIDHARLFHTHNPYNFNDEMDIIRASSLESNLALTVYGKIYDKDINKKFEKTKYMKEKMIGEFNESYETVNDDYLYTIYRICKTKIRVKTR